MRYLLDTNIISDLIRNNDGASAQHIRRLGEEHLCASIIVAAELRYGAQKKGSALLSRAVDVALGGIAVLPFDHPADVAYAELRVKFERLGKLISNNDLLIAAHAISLRCIMVTDNLREFSRIDGLICENWLRRS